jgi:tRNA(Ile)-lysidine synthase
MPKKNPTKRQKHVEREALADSLRRSLRERFGVCAGERLGVGVSGGADSVALLRLFAELREEMGIIPCIVHFNHQLRGKASDADEKFVAQLAAQHGMEFLVARENIAGKAKRERANLEDAGRRARYAWFEQLAKDGRVSRIAVAHTADDQAETVLAHILRGTGLAGLAAIHPQSGSVLRPLLGTRRAALRAYLRTKRQTWREDATNRDQTRTRSRIRHQLLPLLEKKFQPAVVEHLCQLAVLAREDNVHLEFECGQRLAALAKESKGGISIGIRNLNFGAGRVERWSGSGLEREISGTGSVAEGEVIATGSAAQAGVPVPLAMAKRMVRQLVARVKPRSGELAAQHVEAVLRLARSGHSGKLLQLPGGVEVRRERDCLVFRPAASAPRQSAPISFSRVLHLPSPGGESRFDALSRILLLRVIDWPSEGRETINTGALLDRDRLRNPLVLRHWRPGDSMRPAGHLNQHTLARLLNELGLNRWEKAAWPVLTSAGKVAWALGLPAAEEFALREGSRAALVITEETST